MDKDIRGGAGAARVARAIAALPGVVLGVVPALAVVVSPGPVFRAWPWPLAAAPLAAAGLALMAWTIALFARRGKGTLAPWDAPSRLVVEGPYRHVRNPMMTGVFLVLAAEATLFRTPLLLLWLAVFVPGCLAFIPLVEEPRLLRRFGEGYERYRSAVPRWIPRPRPWRG